MVQKGPKMAILRSSKLGVKRQIWIFGVKKHCFLAFTPQFTRPFKMPLFDILRFTFLI